MDDKVAVPYHEKWPQGNAQQRSKGKWDVLRQVVLKRHESITERAFHVDATQLKKFEECEFLFDPLAL